MLVDQVRCRNPLVWLGAPDQDGQGIQRATEAIGVSTVPACRSPDMREGMTPQNPDYFCTTRCQEYGRLIRETD